LKEKKDTQSKVCLDLGDIKIVAKHSIFRVLFICKVDTKLDFLYFISLVEFKIQKLIIGSKWASSLEEMKRKEKELGL